MADASERSPLLGEPRTEPIPNRDTIDQPQTTKSLLHQVFGFNKTPFTLLIIATYLVYFVVLGSIQFEQPTPKVGEGYGPYMSDVWRDLKIISGHPHPYLSHACDDIRNFIASEVIVASADTTQSVTISDDIRRRTMFQNFGPTSPLAYYEADSYLARIEGSDPSLPAVMVAAHFDSVPTSFGTTDDGAAIASMLGMWRYFMNAQEKPLRTLIFHFTSNEEFSLFGARAFLDHPWSKDVGLFLNLDGAGAGGRPVLVRTTDYGAAKHFKAARFPHGTSIFQQGLEAHLVRSGTDFEIYSGAGMSGIDFCFYKPRDLYHTRRDSINEISFGAVAQMFSNSLDIIQSMTSDAGDRKGADYLPAVYFDILGKLFIVFPLNKFIVFSIVSLVAGPVVLLILLGTIGLFEKRNNVHVISRRSWTRGPTAFVFSGLTMIGVARWLYRTNPDIVMTHTEGPLIMLLALYIASNYAVLKIASKFRPVHDQKLNLFLEQTLFWWILSVIATVRAHKYHYTGEYLPILLFWLALTASVIGLFGILVDGSLKNHSDSRKDEYEPVNHEDDESQNVITVTVSHTRNESCPPLEHHRSTSRTNETAGDENETVPISKLPEEPERLGLMWIIQFVVFIPLGLYFTLSTALLILNTVSLNGEEDDRDIFNTFGLLIVFAALIGSLCVPFVHRIHIYSFFFFIIVFGYFLVSLTVESPFSYQTPLKLRFIQTVDLDNLDAGAEVTLTGLPLYAYDALDSLPVRPEIRESSYGNGTHRVVYEGERPYVTEYADYNDWMSVNATTHKSFTTEGETSPAMYKPHTGSLRIHIEKSRACMLRFNTSSFDSLSSPLSASSPVRSIKVFHDNPELDSDGKLDPPFDEFYATSYGLRTVLLHKLNWTNPVFHVQLEWIGTEDKENVPGSGDALGVQVTCQWAEYDDAVVVEGQMHRKIPALDQLLQYSPSYLTFANADRALVQVLKYAEL